MQDTKYIHFILLALFGCLLLGSCGKAQLAPADYVAWVNDASNGLYKEKQVQPLTVSAVYKPIPYVIANEKRSNQIDPTEYQQRKEELAGMQYVTLKLGIIGEQKDITNYEVQTDADLQERLSYLSFAMQKDIQLIDGQDTLACALYHFERSYDLTPQRTFVLGFEKKSTLATDKTLVLNLPYFNTGPIKLAFKANDLQAIPELKL